MFSRVSEVNDCKTSQTVIWISVVEKEKLPATLAYFTILIWICYIAFVLHGLAFTTGCVIAC